MSSLRFSCKKLVVLTLFTSAFSPLIVADNIHRAEKRQIGVLARTGALPQGKRSVEVLARNGELPQGGGKKDANDEDAEDLFEELERAENLSKLRAQVLAEKLLRQRGSPQYVTAKRSVAALARNGELPQKRLSEAMSRSGYLIKPSQEAAQSPPGGLLDPDDFLADGQSSVIPEFLDERSFRSFLSTGKRSLGSARNFLLNSGMSSNGKRNLGSLARDGSFHGPRYPLMKNRKIRDNFDWADDDDKKSLSASRSFTSLDVLANCCDQYPYQMTRSVDNADSMRRKRDRFGADTDYEDVIPEVSGDGSTLEKRFLASPEPSPSRGCFPMPFSNRLLQQPMPFSNFAPPTGGTRPTCAPNSGIVPPIMPPYWIKSWFSLAFDGRIPQLGRIHQKVQSPSSRRRPHLRPNWL